MSKLKLVGLLLAISATPAFASHFPVPSFNDFPEFYSEGAAAKGERKARSAAPAFLGETGGLHPDPMHTSY